MNQKTVEYTVKFNANRLNEIISKELKRKIFNKKHNLSGEYSEDGGFDIWKAFSFFTTDPYFGPIVKINLKSVSINKEETESKLLLKATKESIYQIQYWFSILFSLFTFGIYLFQVFKIGFNETLPFLILPIIGLIYFLIIELIAKSIESNLICRIENLMMSEKIEFKKIV